MVVQQAASSWVPSCCTSSTFVSVNFQCNNISRANVFCWYIGSSFLPCMMDKHKTVLVLSTPSSNSCRKGWTTHSFTIILLIYRYTKLKRKHNWLLTLCDNGDCFNWFLLRKHHTIGYTIHCHSNYIFFNAKHCFT